jgi:L-threonylcarbamoyladenylate synthase
VKARDPVDRAVRALDRGELVVYPTDTLLGIGARADRPEAVARLLEAKGRPARTPLSVAVSSYEEIEPWTVLDPSARSVARDRLPGPYTLILRASPRARRELAGPVLGPGGTVGLRIPDHPTARALAHRCGPIVSTSANRHGQPPARSLSAARAAFGDRVRVYLAAQPAPSGRPSEILDLTGARPSTIRRA